MAPEPDAGDPERGYARSQKKNEQARAALKPLAAGERPRAVTIGAIAAAVFAVANMVAFLATDGDASLATAIFQSGVLAVVAAGMWQARYWGVLGMQALLAITMVVGAVSLMNAANWAAAVLATTILLAAGVLFWFLVKAMARIQMPPRPGAATSGSGRRSS